VADRLAGRASLRIRQRHCFFSVEILHIYLEQRRRQQQLHTDILHTVWLLKLNERLPTLYVHTRTRNSHPDNTDERDMHIHTRMILTMELIKLPKGLFTQTMIFSVGCDSRIQYCTKIGLFLFLDAAVASDTENHCPCK
jgi:hypothetical protein